mmetsp:Transcript_41019/g.118770  ORF Transcript_41019/g.118770 Transcript_41019/m.118770 type:complete len:249 (-) Transcript_41019:7-753(-)
MLLTLGTFGGPPPRDAAAALGEVAEPSRGGSSAGAADHPAAPSREPAPTAAPVAAPPMASLAAPADVRLMAVKNLLRGLSRDAASDEERGHYASLLEMLEAGPSHRLTHGARPAASVAGSHHAAGEAGEAASSARTAVAEDGHGAGQGVAGSAVLAAVNDTRDRRPSLARAVQSVELLSPPSPPAAAAEVAGRDVEGAGPRAGVGAGHDHVVQLMSMGFEGPDVEAAMRHSGGGLDAALEWLLARASG